MMNTYQKYLLSMVCVMTVLAMIASVAPVMGVRSEDAAAIVTVAALILTIAAPGILVIFVIFAAATTQVFKERGIRPIWGFLPQVLAGIGVLGFLILLLTEGWVALAVWVVLVPSLGGFYFLSPSIWKLENEEESKEPGKTPP